MVAMQRYNEAAIPENKRMRMKDWLLERIGDPNYPGLEWEDPDHGIFRIPWKHAALQGFDKHSDGALFRDWAIHTGKLKSHDPKQKISTKTLKATFRCALHSLPGVEEMRKQARRKGDNACRVYRFRDIPTPPKKKYICKRGEGPASSKGRRKQRPNAPHSASTKYETSSYPSRYIKDNSMPIWNDPAGYNRPEYTSYPNSQYTYYPASTNDPSTIFEPNRQNHCLTPGSSTSSSTSPIPNYYPQDFNQSECIPQTSPNSYYNMDTPESQYSPGSDVSELSDILEIWNECHNLEASCDSDTSNDCSSHFENTERNDSSKYFDLSPLSVTSFNQKTTLPSASTLLSSSQLATSILCDDSLFDVYGKSENSFSITEVFPTQSTNTCPVR